MKALQSALRLGGLRSAVIPTRNASRDAISMKQPYGVSGQNMGMYPNTEGYKKLLAKQKHFADNPDLLVWQMMGWKDYVPFYLTMGLMVVTVSSGVYGLWQMCWPKPVAKE